MSEKKRAVKKKQVFLNDADYEDVNESIIIHYSLRMTDRFSTNIETTHWMNHKKLSSTEILKNLVIVQWNDNNYYITIYCSENTPIVDINDKLLENWNVSNSVLIPKIA